jgi:hypothetical protein
MNLIPLNTVSMSRQNFGVDVIFTDVLSNIPKLPVQLKMHLIKKNLNLYQEKKAEFLYEKKKN